MEAAAGSKGFLSDIGKGGSKLKSTGVKVPDGVKLPTKEELERERASAGSGGAADKK